MNIQQAAVSWFGLPEHTTVVGGEAAGQLVFAVTLTAEDLAGIAHRMQQVEPEPEPFSQPEPTREELRSRYDALPAETRALYGSFKHFLRVSGAEDQTEGIGGREVRHVDVVEEAAAVDLPAAVWVSNNEVSAHQVLLASDQNARGCLLQVHLLTPEQRAKYCGS